MDFNQELFDFYNYILKKEYFKDFKSEYLSYKLFRDILLLALRLKKYDWVQNFVRSYNIKLHPNCRKNMLNYGFAFYYHAKGDFTNSLNYLNKINFDYFIYKYDVRKLKLKIFYELNYLEECLYLIHSSREFLRKDVLLPQERKNSIKLFFYYTEKLIFYKMEKPGYDIGFIKEKILLEKNISNKDWLLEKIKEAETPLSPYKEIKKLSIILQ
jgi:hypothetical protein